MNVINLAIDIDDLNILGSAAAEHNRSSISGMAGCCRVLHLPIGADAK